MTDTKILYDNHIYTKIVSFTFQTIVNEKGGNHGESTKKGVTLPPKSVSYKTVMFHFTSLIFSFHLLPSPVHITGFSFYILPGFLVIV